MSIKTTHARPYAKAAFAEAMQNKSLQQWSALLRAAACAIEQPKFVALLQSPNFSLEKKLKDLLDICESYLFEAAKNFLKILAEKRRLILLPEVASEFEAYRIEQEKITTVHVTSAADLNDAQQKQLTETLSKQLKRGVILKIKIDRHLIGGLIITAGDLVIDGSVRGKLARLAAALVN